ncbi:MAG: universal stress protein [Desulfovibrionaceae bacterium]
MNIQNILLPFDGSVHSDHALDHAVAMAKLTNASITLLTCYDLLPTLDDMAMPHIDEVRRQYGVSANKILVAGREKLEAAGVPFKSVLQEGRAGKIIAEMAGSGRFDMVIMGSGGHSSIAGLLIGSVTHKVLGSIHCPVLIVP